MSILWRQQVMCHIKQCALSWLLRTNRAERSSMAVNHLHRSGTPHICQTERQEIVDDPGLIAAGRARSQFLTLPCGGGLLASMEDHREMQFHICLPASKHERERRCAPVPDGAEVDGVLLHEQGQKGHQSIQGHHEDDAHNVSLHRKYCLSICADLCVISQPEGSKGGRALLGRLVVCSASGA